MENDYGLEEDPKSEVPVAERSIAMYAPEGGKVIPVGKGVGAIWKVRYDAGKKAGQSHATLAENIIAYYRNTLQDYRAETGGLVAGMDSARRTLRREVTYVENLIFANTQALLPHVYSRNPTVEISTSDETDEPLLRAGEKLVNTLASRRGERGLGLKHKVRRCVLAARLTNESYIQIGWTSKDSPSNEHAETLDDLAKELEKAKTQQQVEEIEAKIAAIEEKTDFLNPSGPWTRYRRYDEVIVDPNSVEEDLSDAEWVMVCDFVSNAEILTKYGKKVKDGKHKSIYKPTHVLNVGASNDDDSAMESIVDQSSHEKAGFDDENTYRKAQYTKVWNVWCRRTRRVYMFNDCDWSWPIWVWDDPYKLDTFFPIYRHWHTIDPAGGRAKPEMAYCLDQQDMIDKMNSTRARAVQWASNKIVFNKNVIDKKDVERLLKGDDDNAIGLDIPSDRKLEDVWAPALPPSSQVMQLFDTSYERASLDRISATSEVLRGGQFKTNTTNDAVQSYTDMASMRIGDITDTVEDFVGCVLWGVLQLCFQFMPQKQVEAYIGKTSAAAWSNMTAREIADTLSLEVVGGSTTKPSSRNKKREALEIAQVLGQFSKVPQVVVLILRMFQEAFDGFVVSKEDFDMVIEAIVGEVQGQQGAPQQEGAPEQGDPSQMVGQVLQRVAETIDSLGPEQKAAIAQALQQGTPFKEILTAIMRGNNNAAA